MKRSIQILALLVIPVALAILIVALPQFMSRPAFAVAENAGGKAVLVTGASSGIGRNITERLAGSGYFVYAGARKQADLDELNAIENVQAIRLDVTVQSEIDAAVETVSKAGRGLYGIVNNAGVVTVGSLHEIPEGDLLFQFDVNVYGPYRVSKAFFPLLANSKGRIVNIGSISGVLSSPLLGAYSMSKHAIEAYTDSMAASVAQLGVQVSVIEPGNYKSDILSSAIQRAKDEDQSFEGSIHEDSISQLMTSPADRSQYEEPDAVADAAVHALFDYAPKRRYLVVPNQREAEITIRKAIEELVQLNQDHPFTYDRDALVAMVDEAIAAATRPK
ncbi:MAG: SDR family NAD(P)-dependent oxidoreductase [Gammaproteobacteria bacterium]|nr:SDR family NAD(P)-dependent oxidoreductase [Gammaproteobacteria bacterium]MDH4316676.1 SDR family NAD(P)-dependent oxidoreductase [Gammaproteobacteria bacterium]MDH5215883.1 SDR family NAD(P)-dependent oxidoreductase [Gammaproteobacteria bacterium]MDH5501631.1 SDR family NAD(P)-dependent oxidoreductase [Gammaproteobacteria bacterium]